MKASGFCFDHYSLIFDLGMIKRKLIIAASHELFSNKIYSIKEVIHHAKIVSNPLG